MATKSSSIEQLTIDELAAATGTTSRSIRSFQTLGLLEHPDLRGRTGLYTAHHLRQLRAILGLQAQGFSLQSMSVLFAAHQRGQSLDAVLGLDGGTERRSEGFDHSDIDTAELYGFAELQGYRRGAGRRGRPLLAVVPTTVWEQTEAS